MIVALLVISRVAPARGPNSLGAIALHPQNLPKVLGGTVDEHNYAAVQKCVFLVTVSLYLEERAVLSPYLSIIFKQSHTIGNPLTVQKEESLRPVTLFRPFLSC